MNISKQKPKVLIVEDDRSWQNNYEDSLGDKVNIIHAFTVGEGERLFLENPDIDLVVMDACVPGDKPTTLPLTSKIRETFYGPMIAASSDEIFRKQLMKNGCDHEAEKRWVPRKIRELLGLK